MIELNTRTILTLFLLLYYYSTTTLLLYYYYPQPHSTLAADSSAPSRRAHSRNVCGQWYAGIGGRVGWYCTRQSSCKDVRRA